MAEQLSSDQRVKAYPAHGAVIEDAKSKIEEYISHRQQREEEILAALAAEEGNTAEKEMTAMQIVKVVYKDVPETLHLPAQNGVLQVLAKLEGEGKVAKNGKGRWSAKVKDDSSSRSTL